MSRLEIFSIISASRRGSQSPRLNSSLLRYCSPWVTCTQIRSFIETWNQKMYLLMRRAILSWLISVSPSSLSQIRQLSLSAELLSIWLQRFWTWRVMVLLSIGGHLASSSTKWRRVDHHLCTKTITDSVFWFVKVRLSSHIQSVMEFQWVKNWRILLPNCLQRMLSSV